MLLVETRKRRRGTRKQDLEVSLRYSCGVTHSCAFMRVYWGREGASLFRTSYPAVVKHCSRAGRISVSLFKNSTASRAARKLRAFLNSGAGFALRGDSSKSARQQIARKNKEIIALSLGACSSSRCCAVSRFLRGKHAGLLRYGPPKIRHYLANENA